MDSDSWFLSEYSIKKNYNYRILSLLSETVLTLWSWDMLLERSVRWCQKKRSINFSCWVGQLINLVSGQIIEEAMYIHTFDKPNMSSATVVNAELASTATRPGTASFQFECREFRSQWITYLFYFFPIRISLPVCNVRIWLSVIFILSYRHARLGQYLKRSRTPSDLQIMSIRQRPIAYRSWQAETISEMILSIGIGRSRTLGAWPHHKGACFLKTIKGIMQRRRSLFQSKQPLHRSVVVSKGSKT